MLRAAWESLRDRHPVTFEQFCEFVADWEIHPACVDGEPVGAVFVKGPEIHACIKGGFGRWMGKWCLRLVNRIVSEHGYAQTVATTDAGREFVTRLGFVKHGNVYRRERKWDLNH